MKKLFILISAVALASCTLFERKAQTAAVVTIGDAYLTQMQIDEVTLNATSPEDSAAIAEAYIKQWAEDVLFYDKARKNKDDEIEALTANYRRTLYLHKYEEYLIKKEMATEVSPDSIENFYNEHPELFTLGTDILKGLFIIIPKDASNQKNLQKWLQKPEENIAEIEAYAYQNATGYELFLDQWVNINQINIKFPSEKSGLSEQLRKDNLIEVSDSSQTYILRLTDKRFIGQTMPLDFAEEEIRNILLSQRRKQFLAAYREQLYENAHIKQ